jgi:hypothetical protein
MASTRSREHDISSAPDEPSRRHAVCPALTVEIITKDTLSDGAIVLARQKVADQYKYRDRNRLYHQKTWTNR